MDKILGEKLTISNFNSLTFNSYNNLINSYSIYVDIKFKKKIDFTTDF